MAINLGITAFLVAIGILVMALFLHPLFTIDLGIEHGISSNANVLVVDSVSSRMMIRVGETSFPTSSYLLIATSEFATNLESRKV